MGSVAGLGLGAAMAEEMGGLEGLAEQEGAPPASRDARDALRLVQRCAHGGWHEGIADLEKTLEEEALLLAGPQCEERDQQLTDLRAKCDRLSDNLSVHAGYFYTWAIATGHDVSSADLQRQVRLCIEEVNQSVDQNNTICACNL